MEVPVYLFTGFMDSGKTTLIRQTLLENEFGEGGKILLIVCEDGDVEYQEEELKKVNTTLVMLEKEEDFNAAKFLELQKQHCPEFVFIEYNGTWEMATFLEMDFPKNWILVQSLATVDAMTFEIYLKNMRSMILEQLFLADAVIFNRCQEDTPKAKFRRAVKAKNPKAQIVYERADGTIDEGDMEELPFDIQQEIIEITDMDYGIWYLDALDHPKKYHGKKVRFLGLVYRPEKLKKGIFFPGRFAMTCCEDDIAFVGFKCKSDNASEIGHRTWITITAEVKYEFAMEYKGKGPVLYAIQIEPAEEPMEKLVYFT